MEHANVGLGAYFVWNLLQSFYLILLIFACPLLDETTSEGPIDFYFFLHF